MIIISEVKTVSSVYSDVHTSVPTRAVHYPDYSIAHQSVSHKVHPMCLLSTSLHIAQTVVTVIFLYPFIFYFIIRL